MKLNPQEGAKKWGDRLTQAIPDVKAGIDKVQESPTAKAASKGEKWMAGIQRAHTSGKWKRGLLSVTLEAWKMKTRDVGADRIAGGVAAAGEKMGAFYGKLYPFQEKLQGQIKTMPDASIQDSIARMTKWVMGMTEFDKTK
jgi:hypothetical protein